MAVIVSHAGEMSFRAARIEHVFVLILSDELLENIRQWPTLKRWQRREVGQQLRCSGLSYSEIASLIPVTKGTLSGWCRDISLTDDQKARLALRPGRIAFARRQGADRRRRALQRAAEIRESARTEVAELRSDPFWMAGVVAYWAEGAKRNNDVTFANSDPALICLFISWAARSFDLGPERFTAKLHLHAGQDDAERKRYWSDITGIPVSEFRKTFIKIEGTGHRKNVLYNGTIQVRITRSTDLLHRLEGWIEEVASLVTASAKLSTGR
jgi:hypothetical protein